jgi:membrane protease YdiL (CAAX protease family)
MLGGWSPTIASYISLKKNKKVAGFKDWMKNVFDLKHNLFSYIIVLIFSVIYIVPQCLISGYEKGMPLIAIVVMIPIMLFGGGLEEAGWRYILQPELEKKHNYFVSTLIVSVIWLLWHLPLFYIQGTSQNSVSLLFFAINVLGLSFALASIKKNTNSVWLCVLFHCIVNSLSGIYIVEDNLVSSIVTSIALIAGSLVINKINAVKKICK